MSPLAPHAFLGMPSIFLQIIYLQTRIIPMVYPVKDGADGLVPALTQICDQAAAAVGDGYKIIVLSDRMASKDFLPVP